MTSLPIRAVLMRILNAHCVYETSALLKTYVNAETNGNGALWELCKWAALLSPTREYKLQKYLEESNCLMGLSPLK